eukprot:TRINITY_DN2249_c0_g1_i1.p1 TRINITY_DN2249_c0_g1~~TRINITY_DN2249_c0_g1_i1.p1  ORF type:complete len:487 (-),score=139.50 TRINITY_DN2249_c0_g1_i1:157-1617(-)
MPSQSKFASLLACGAAGYGVSQAFTSVSAPSAAGPSKSGRLAMQKDPAKVSLYGSACSGACTITGVALAASAASVSKRRAKVCVMALAQDDEELAFMPGQRVMLLGPPAMAGKQGTIVGPDLGETFKVQLESGSLFSIATENIQDVGGATPAAASVPSRPASAAPVASPVPVAVTQDDEELEFTAGQRVNILAPPAMAGKQGTVIGPALDNTFSVQLDSGSVFNIATENMLDAAGGHAPAAAAAPAAVAAAAPVAANVPATVAAQDDEELAFTQGQRVTILAPPAMAGKQGTVVGPSLGDTFSVQLDSGSVFNIATENMLDAAGGHAPAPAAAAPAAVAAAAPVASHASAAVASQNDEELEFTPGQRVTILAPPAMFGKQGIVIKPLLDDTFSVRLDSGSVFNILTENMQDAAMPISAAVNSAASESDEEGFEKGQLVEILAPPPLAGKQGTIGGADLDDCWMVVLASGSVFSIKTRNLRKISVRV